MKDLNKELSQKLEVQTQRLELLTSQSMSMVGAGDANNNNNIPPRKPTSRTVVDHTPYADEGDEVSDSNSNSNRLSVIVKITFFFF